MNSKQNEQAELKTDFENAVGAVNRAWQEMQFGNENIYGEIVERKEYEGRMMLIGNVLFFIIDESNVMDYYFVQIMDNNGSWFYTKIDGVYGKSFSNK